MANSSSNTQRKRVPAGTATSTTTAAARNRVLASKDRFWRPTQLPGPASTVQHLLGDLTSAGDLVHVRKGLYWRGRQTPLGMSRPPVDALVRELAAGRGVGPAGLSAAHQLRLSTQIPRRSEVAVPARAPSDAGPVKFVSRAARAGRRTAALKPADVAVLEALEGWDRVIGIPLDDAWRQLRQLLTSGEVSAERLSRAAKTEPAAVRARLARLLGDSGNPAAADRVPRPDPRTEQQALRDVPAQAGR
jgi:hypothetical protein